jgi:membrane-bound lytic murein transglycosylase D
VRFQTPPTVSILLILLGIAGCSTAPVAIPPQIDEAAPPAAETASSEVPVIERLVYEAAARRRQQLDRAPSESDDLELSIEPRESTIPMTPNRIVEQTMNDFLQNRRNVLQVWASRGQIYFPMIEQIFEEEGIPEELKYLALSESGLNPNAGSPAGAVGMWQFMPVTGRGEGLRVDNWVDERRDPEKATRAAARHIKALQRDYNGRWHLTLAGYNCSYRCITNAVKRAGYSMEEPPSYWDVYPNLPKETRNFVPTFIATALILSNPEMYGVPVQDLGQRLEYDVVHVKGMLRLDDAARLAGTDLATLRTLNPALLKATLPNDPEPYELKIPLGSFDQFVANFTKEAPTGSSIADSGEYVVKSGDTLGKIARQHGTTVAEIQAMNGLRGTMINVNQKLQIPGKGGISNIQIASTERLSVEYPAPSFNPIKLGDEFQLVHQRGSTPEKPLLAVSLNLSVIEPDEGALSLAPTIYKVKSGDTLGSIARQFGVSLNALQSNNNLNGTTIFPNQELRIHTATTIVDPPKPGATRYQVQQGDNLYDIARRHNMSVDSLKQKNQLNDNVIHPGQALLVD